MTATRDAVVSCRVPLDLRSDLEEVAALEGHGELSLVARAALRAYADHKLGRSPVGASMLLGGTGARRRTSGPTEVAAALKVAPRVGTQRRRVLELYEEVGPIGLTADAVHSCLEGRDFVQQPIVSLRRHHAVNGIARRVTDLLQGGLIIEKTASGNTADRKAKTDGEGVTQEGVLTRQTRHGAQAIVYVISAAGHRALEDVRAREAAKARA